MNSLVAYDNSGSESSEDETVPIKEAVSNDKPKPSTQKLTESYPETIHALPSDQDDVSSSKMLKNQSAAKTVEDLSTNNRLESKPIALPSRQITSINFDLNVLDKNRSQPIRITVPSLKDFEDEEPANKAKLKPSVKGCGLFSLLPEPKNVTSTTSAALVPQSVSKVRKVIPKPTAKKQFSTVTKSKQIVDDNDDDNAEPVSSFFFTEHEDNIPVADIEPIIDPTISSSKPIHTPVANYVQHAVGGDSKLDQALPTYSKLNNYGNGSVSNEEASTDETAQLDDNALLRLCGARERKKKCQEMPEIIDIDTNVLIGDSALLMTKELSKEQPSLGYKRKSECSSVQRRKHQITYLAEQAKAQELELRNTWAQNRMTKKQTQAKYGF